MTSISRQQIDDQDMVARYLADQLSDSERSAFEAYYLEHPEVVAELNRTAQFKSGLIDLERSGALKSLLRRSPWWRNSRTLALAASLIVLIVAGGIFLQQQTPSRTLLALSSDDFSGAQVGSTITLERTRSSSYDATIEIPKNPAPVELKLRPEASDHSSIYKVAIGVAGQNDNVTWLSEVAGARQASDGFVRVYLDASKLLPAVYEVKMFSNTAASANSSNSFLIEAVPAAR